MGKAIWRDYKRCAQDLLKEELEEARKRKEIDAKVFAEIRAKNKPSPPPPCTLTIILGK